MELIPDPGKRYTYADYLAWTEDKTHGLINDIYEEGEISVGIFDEGKMAFDSIFEMQKKLEFR